MLRKSVVVATLLLTSLLCVRFARLTPGLPGTDDAYFSEKVNLALRRTAHYLLLANGDSTSRIAPVQRLSPGNFLVRLERPFNYERLPVLLQESFRLHDIRLNYDVAVLNCTDDLLLLGYNGQEVQPGQGIPCGGRALDDGCYNLQITFVTPPVPLAQHLAWWVLAGSFLFGGMYYAWSPRKKEIPVLSSASADASSPERLHFGRSSLDVANQTLLTGVVRHQLTYRETKLLLLFINHLNQLLERSFILQAVWEDEGIMVGRSVDVFVSRLRKMLREDPSLQIVTVHGVGYRLEALAEN